MITLAQFKSSLSVKNNVFFLRKTKESTKILHFLQYLGCISSFELVKKTYKIYLKICNNSLVLKKIILTSKPSKKNYKNIYSLKAVNYNNKITEELLFTTKGINNANMSIIKNTGGLFLSKFFF